MRLTAGTRVGPYEVVALLGAGGMAEVYRARDTRLGREVAIKVVSEALGADGAFLERFEREAKLAGSLNHPNVVALHDVGLHDGKPYFVTELLQGETLRERLAKGPIPLGKALEWAAQMAQGLAAAHERGIVHRDLKPENVFITRDGPVKLLDFGIAKLVEAVPEATPHGLLDETVSPSGSSTGTGMVLGTPGYMSPEQVRGDPVDARTDFFSLGSVLYEMLCGHRAFPSGSVVESGYAILHNEPESLPANIPVPVGQVVRWCLEKDRGRRVQSARDLAFNLDLLRSPTSSVRAMSASSTNSWRRRWLALPLAAIGLMAVTFYIRVPVQRQSIPSVRRFTFRDGFVASARFGPDGRTVFFSASWSGEPQRIYSTTLDNPDYHALGVEDAALLSVSPSGELAVLLHRRAGVGTLARVPGVGGVPREVADEITCADWAPDGVNMVIARQTAGGSQVEYPIGTIVYKSSHSLDWVRLSPKGGQIAFVEYTFPVPDARGNVVVLEPGRPKRVLLENWEVVTGLAWAPAGDEVWLGGDRSSLEAPSLWAVSLGGELRRVNSGLGQPSPEDIARDGRALVRDLHILNDVGVMSLAQRSVNAHLGSFDWPVVGALSDDGRSMLIGEIAYAAAAFSARNGGGGYWAFLQRTDGSPAVRLGSGMPRSFSHDGKWALVFDSGHVGRIWLLPTGTGASRSVDFPGLDFASGSMWGHFLPDAKQAVVAARQPDGVRGYVVDLESGQSRAVTPPLGCCDAYLSPDGHSLAAKPLDGGWTAYPIESGPARSLPGVGGDEALIAWTTTGWLLVTPDTKPAQEANMPVRISRVNSETGARQPLTTFRLGDTPGIHRITSLLVAPDEQTVAYSYTNATSRLYLFEFQGQK